MSIEGQLRELIVSILRDELAKLRPESSEHVTVSQYARRWSISESTVRLAIREKRLAIKRVGRVIRIHPDAEITRNTATDRARLVLMRGGTK